MPETSRSWLLGLILVAVLVLTAAVLAATRLWPRDSVQSPARQDDRLVAEVNGLQIHESDLTRGIPSGLTGAARERAMKSRLLRLARNEMLRKFLADNEISVPEEHVEQHINALRENPSSHRCEIHKGGDIDKQLLQDYSTLNDLRNEIRNHLGIEKYLDRCWETDGKHTGRDRQEWMREKRSEIIVMADFMAENAISE